MAGIEGIKNRIEAECGAECSRILEAAQAEAGRIAAANDAQLAKMVGDLEDKTEVTVVQKKRIAESNAALAVRRERLAARQELIGKVFDEARRQLMAMKADEYLRIVLRFLSECEIKGGETLCLSANAARVRGDSAMVSINDAIAPKKLVFGAVTDEIEGGFILLSGESRQVCSFEAVIEQARAEMETEVAGILFEQA